MNGSDRKHATPPPAIAFAIAAVSASSLAAEIVLMRIFSIIEWHQFAWLIISLALLGYGASGTILSIFRRTILRFDREFAVILPAMSGLTLVVSLMVVTRIDWRSLELLWNPSQVLNLLSIYLLLAIPFCCNGMFIGMSLMRWPESIGRLYGADLSGAACGAILAIILLRIAEPRDAWSALAVIGLVVSLLLAWTLRRSLTSIALAIGAVMVVTRIALPAIVEPGEYKALSQALRIPGAEVVAETSSPLGYVQIIENERVPLRYATGLSLNYFEELPIQKGAFVDGEGPVILNETSRRLEHVDHTTFGVVLELLDSPHKVFIAGLAGMPELVRLHQRNTPRIMLSETDPRLIHLVISQRGHGGEVFSSKRVTILDGDPRSNLAMIEGRLDLIFVPFSPGESALEPASLVTAESFELMLDRLSENGLIVITTLVDSPPRTVPRLFSTLATAVEANRLDPAKHIAAIRGWDAATVLVSRLPLGEEKIGIVRDFAERNSFDIVWVPGMRAEEANRFNRLDKPWHHEAARAILGDPEARARFTKRYKFDVSPTTDDRPWFGSAMKWPTLVELFGLREEGGTALIRNGYPVLLLATVQALVAGIALILLPLALARGTRSGVGTISRWRVVVGFGSLGLAFFFIEILYIYRLEILLGRPLEATTIVLASFLLFSGLGSLVSRRVVRAARRGAATILVASTVSIAVVTLLEIPLLGSVGEWIANAPHSIRAMICVALIAPLAFAMGIPFPTALGLLRRLGTEWWIGWAWAINGCASVVSAILAVLLAIHIGMCTVTVLAALLYLVAGWVLATSGPQNDESSGAVSLG